MSLEIIPRAEVTRVDWDELVRGSPDGWAFSLWSWQELILAVETWALEDHSFAIREGNRLIAAVPLQYNPSSSRMGSTGWGGSGPIVDGRLHGRARSKLMERAIQLSIERARARGASCFEVSLSPVTATSIASTWGVNPFVFYGLEDCSAVAQVIDLSKSEDELWGDLTSDARRQIRQAREAGLVVQRVDWAKHLDRYYELHTATYKRTGVQPHPRSYFAGIAAHMAASGYSVLWAAVTPLGEVVAYHNAAWFGYGAYYHTGCSVEPTSFPGAGYLLFWEAMLGAKREGVRWYDCGSVFPGKLATDKQKGLSTFKSKFGGQLHRQFFSEFNFQLCQTAVKGTSVASGFLEKIWGGIRAKK